MWRPLKISIFDFDGTLFRSPYPPVDWQGSWWGNTASLHPPIVPEIPGPDWWNQDVVERAKQAIADPDTVTALVTGRLASKFTLRVKDLLSQVGLNFHHLELCDGDDTLKFKMRVIDRLMKDYSSARGVNLWEDREEHLRQYADHVESSGRAAFPHLVTIPSHEPGTVVSAASVADRYLRK